MRLMTIRLPLLPPNKSQYPVTILVIRLSASLTIFNHRLPILRRLVLGPLALAPSNMRESLTDSLNVSAFKGTKCKDARIIRCTESDRDKCESEVKN